MFTHIIGGFDNEEEYVFECAPQGQYYDGYEVMTALSAPTEDTEEEFYEVRDAAEQMFRDEFGAEPAYNGAVFDITAVPDDVAEALPPADGIAVLFGEQFSDPRTAVNKLLGLFEAKDER